MTQPVESLDQTNLSETTLEATVDKDWLDGDLSRLEDYEPYDWGEIDPLTLGQPIKYIPSIGLVVEGIKNNA